MSGDPRDCGWITSFTELSKELSVSKSARRTTSSHRPGCVYAAPRKFQKSYSTCYLPAELGMPAEVMTHLELVEDHADVHGEQRYTGKAE